jgi:capsule polysaccharide modification protein KpsS
MSDAPVKLPAPSTQIKRQEDTIITQRKRLDDTMANYARLNSAAAGLVLALERIAYNGYADYREDAAQALAKYKLARSREV